MHIVPPSWTILLELDGVNLKVQKEDIYRRSGAV